LERGTKCVNTTAGRACNPILIGSILSYPILSYPILSYPILSYPIQPAPHNAPPAGAGTRSPQPTLRARPAPALRCRACDPACARPRQRPKPLPALGSARQPRRPQQPRPALARDVPQHPATPRIILPHNIPQHPAPATPRNIPPSLHAVLQRRCRPIAVARVPRHAHRARWRDEGVGSFSCAWPDSACRISVARCRAAQWQQWPHHRQPPGRRPPRVQARGERAHRRVRDGERRDRRRSAAHAWWVAPACTVGRRPPGHPGRRWWWGARGGGGQAASGQPQWFRPLGVRDQPRPQYFVVQGRQLASLSERRVAVV
jgi:hypothetical protein